jgi:uncharacterized protein (DUF305 family)
MVIRKSNALCLAATIALTTAAGLGAQTRSDPEHRAQHQMMKGMTEAEFVPMMIKHHQDGIEMARVEEQKGTSQDVKTLAAKIRESQEREISEMKQASAGGAQGTSGHEGHDMMEHQSQAVMKRLNSASGQALDRAFLEEMAKHHEMAIQMAESAKIGDSELKQVVQKMVSGQRQELAELKKQLAANKSK